MASGRHRLASTRCQHADVSDQFAGGTPFTVAGLPVASDALRLEVGVDIDATETLSLGFAYSGEISTAGQTHKATASATVKF